MVYRFSMVSAYAAHSHNVEGSIMKFKSIQIYVIGLQDWEDWTPIRASVFKWHANRIADKLKGDAPAQNGVNNYTIKRIPLLVKHVL
jgi:hypothetical protein